MNGLSKNLLATVLLKRGALQNAGESETPNQPMYSPGGNKLTRMYAKKGPRDALRNEGFVGADPTN